MNYTDDQLSAYLDGELSLEERQSIDQELARDPALRESLARLQRVDQLLSEALGPIAEEAVPDHILDLINGHGRGANPDGVIDFARWQRMAKPLAVPTGLAASLLFGLVLGPLVFSSGLSDSPDGLLAGPVANGSNVLAVLESTPSGTEQYGITPVLSFATEAGACREIRTLDQRALACVENGTWSVVLVVQETASPSADGYRTASAQTGLAFDIMADQLMAGPPLSAEDEAIRIGRNWAFDYTPADDEQE